MIKIKTCTRDNLCVDCDNTKCLHAGNIEADCPKWRCDNGHKCGECEFIRKYQDAIRTEGGTDD